jgi:hypothetical protein
VNLSLKMGGGTTLVLLLPLSQGFVSLEQNNPPKLSLPILIRVNLHLLLSGYPFPSVANLGLIPRSAATPILDGHLSAT